MVNRFLFFRALLFSVFFLPGFSQSNDYEEIETVLLEEFISKIKKKNESITHFQANFKEISSLGIRQGKIYIKRPELLKMEYYRGELVDLKIYANKENLYIHFVNEKIVYEQKFNSEKLSELENRSALISFDSLFKDYNFNFIQKAGLIPVFSGSELKKFNLSPNFSLDAYCFSLTPKDITRQLDSMKICFDEKGQLVRVFSKNVKDETRDIYFYNFNDNALPKNLFEFIIPANVRVIKNILPKFQNLIDSN